MVALGGCASFFVGNAFQAQMPEYAHDLGTGNADFSYTALLAANAAGAVIGGLVLESRGLLVARPLAAIVLASASVITGMVVLTWTSGLLGLVGVVFCLIGFFAPTSVHIF